MYRPMTAAAVLALLGCTVALPAAALPDDPGSYARKKTICYREGALIQTLAGDALARFTTQCMGDATTTGRREVSQAVAIEAAAHERCRTEGASQRSLTGDRLVAFVRQCTGE